MTIFLRIIGFHNFYGCSLKVTNALHEIGVELVELDRESWTVTINATPDRNPERIRHALQLRLKKPVIVLSQLVPANQNPSPIQEVAAPVVVGLVQALDGVEITRTDTNTTRVYFIHRDTPTGGVQIRDAYVEHVLPRPPPRSPPWTATEPSAPMMPVAEQAVYGYPRGYYYSGVSKSCGHDHSNGCCGIM